MVAHVYPSPAEMRVTIDVQFPDHFMDSDDLMKKLPGAMRKVAQEGKNFWKAAAGRRLRSSREAYLKAIDTGMTDDLSFNFTLEGGLATRVEWGGPQFDMKPGLLKNAKPWTKRKIPRAIAKTLNLKASFSRYQIVPLNPNHYINMQKPTTFRMVTDKSPTSSWMNPKNKIMTGVHITNEVVDELNDKIIPNIFNTLLEEYL